VSVGGIGGDDEESVGAVGKGSVGACERGHRYVSFHGASPAQHLGVRDLALREAADAEQVEQWASLGALFQRTKSNKQVRRTSPSNKSNNGEEGVKEMMVRR
jgi:hypothetical protein